MGGICFSGCFDRILRVWDVAEQKVVDWLQSLDVITSMAVAPDGTSLVVGFLSGFIRFYTTEGKLKFVSEVECRDRIPKRVTNLEFSEDSTELIVSTCDSAIRLVDVATFSILQVYIGHSNMKHNIKAHFA
eukprot:TRINITY_DN7906_c0_g1_i2.p1 TRINITY_DN7906_c0_g1~~TRINITY_DN7906_c0_g1_i2.p1  ORF type:complete len:131 (-),score=14.02 TRINITY_DN7906_c0_g1_i2:439-831(-)